LVSPEGAAGCLGVLSQAARVSRENRTTVDFALMAARSTTGGRWMQGCLGLGRRDCRAYGLGRGSGDRGHGGDSRRFGAMLMANCGGAGFA
jgi:hypothetical protein